jgi:flagellar biosynthesis protein FlhA
VEQPVVASGIKTTYISEWLKSSSTLIGMGIIGVLLVMMIPLPSFILDILLSLNITFSLLILLVAVYSLKPLDFSVFPSILLVATLARLSLNVASTRLILLHGNEGTAAAGHVIKAFGTFVVGGNFVVGFIVFFVLVLINFIVITKGATRIAEVAARFTLDAMPGKQMSIDADLNAGLINDSEARKRRGAIEREADFYGAMDGASKFVRGDAVAGIIITLINIIGGLVVGVIQKGMQADEAAQTYTLLTVGDGLVTQIPALIVSTAAGMLVTRSASSADFGKEVTGQLIFKPKAIVSASIILFIFGMIPGMPTVAFLSIAFAMAAAAFTLSKKSFEEGEIEKEHIAEPPPETLESLLPLDILELDVGYTLIPLVDSAREGELLQRIKAFRRQLVLEMGFVMPAIHIRDNLQLKPNEYMLKLKGAQIARGELLMGHLLAITPDEKLKIKGVDTKEPAFGLPAVWVNERERENLQAKGVVVVDPATVITTHITEIVKSHAAELVGRQDVQSLLDNLSQDYPALVSDLVPNAVPLGVLHKVIQRLLKERVSIRDMITIVETLADYIPVTKNVDLLTGYVRQSLSRTITSQYTDANGDVTVVLVAPDMEDAISESVQHTEYESFVTAESALIQSIMRNLQGYVKNFTEKGLQPVILCSPRARSALWKIVEKFFPSIAVLSHSEVTYDVNIKSLGMLRLQDAGQEV